MLGSCADDVLLLSQCVHTMVTSSFLEKCHHRELHPMGLLANFPSLNNYTLVPFHECCSTEVFKECPGFPNLTFGLFVTEDFNPSVLHVECLKNGQCIFFLPFPCWFACAVGWFLFSAVTVLISPVCALCCSFKSSSLCNIDCSPLTVSQQRINP